MSERLFTPLEAATYLRRRNVWPIYRAARKWDLSGGTEGLRHEHDGRRVLIPESALIEWRKRHGEGSASPG